METTTTTKGSKNIIAVFDLASAGEVEEGLNWYARAERIACRLSHDYDIDMETCAGVIAALSPNNRWERNTVDAENIIRAYVDGSPDDALNVKVCTYGKMKEKAVRVLESSGTTEEIARILNGRKITAFFYCIIGSHDHVCIDGHAYSIWFGDRLTMKDVPNIGKRLCNCITEDYVAATEQINNSFGHQELTPYQVQAITWCAWRRLHGVTK